MRILYIHTFYQLKGGEDNVFFQEKELIGKYEKVNEVLYHNHSGTKGILQFILSVWNVFSTKKLKKTIKDFKPDIIHIHNLHFAVGPLAIRVAKKYGIPVVLTLHNYRLICPSATLYFDGKLFTASVNASFPWSAVKKGVYRKSKLLTFWLAFNTWVHKKAGTWNRVDRYIVLTDFAKGLFVNSSLNISPSKFVLKPNFVKDILLPPVIRTKIFLFLGRLSEEKGIKVLLETFQTLQQNLIIAGAGPLQKKVEEVCSRCSNIQYIGHLNTDEIQQYLAKCDALIFPSVWYEGMPITILEAFARGTPVIASNLGAMQAMVKEGYNGLHFNVNNANDLAEKVVFWSSMAKFEKEKYYFNARKTYLENYTPKQNFEILLDIYNDIYLK